jgi:hypothetical protein
MGTTVKTMTTMIRYTFQNGTVGYFQGPRRYRLSGSFREAMDEIGDECRARGEAFDSGQLIGPEIDDDRAWLADRWTYRGCLIGRETLPGPILVRCNGGVNRHLSRVWRVVFPDDSWCQVGTRDEAVRYVDRVGHRYGVAPRVQV